MTRRRQRKSHLADAINRNIEKHPAVKPVWMLVIAGLFVFAMIMYFSK